MSKHHNVILYCILVVNIVLGITSGNGSVSIDVFILSRTSRVHRHYHAHMHTVTRSGSQHARAHSLFYEAKTPRGIDERNHKNIGASIVATHLSTAGE